MKTEVNIRERLRYIRSFSCLATLILFSSLGGFSQEQVEFLSASEVNAKRYEDIDGDPYVFKEFQYGKVLTLENGIVDSVMVNYNGFSKLFEVQQSDKLIELDPKYYPLIIVYEGNEEVYFKRTLLKKVGASYSRIVHTNDHCTLLHSFYVEKNTEISNLGGVKDYISFMRKKTYNIEVDAGSFLIKLNKKGILTHLEDKEKIKKFAKKNKLSFNKEKDVIKILDYYASLR